MPTEQSEQEPVHADRTRAGRQAGRRAGRPAVRPAGPRRRNPLRSLRRLRNDAGAATAEYLVATMAAVGFAGLLIVILRGNEVRGILTELVRNALSVG